MTTVRAIPQDADRLSMLSSALGIRIVSGSSLSAGVTAVVVRRLAAVMAPCTRSDLLARAETALHGCLGESPSELLEEVLNDLVVGGDLDEQPALLEDQEDSPVLIFCCQPAFFRMGSRIHLIGASPDDAPCLPDSLAQDVWIDGGLRYLSTDSSVNSESMAQVLARIGLRELSVDRWAGATFSRPPDVLLEQARAVLRSRGFESEFVGVRWLTPRKGSESYRQRWCESSDRSGLVVARAPQPFGADAWYLVDRDGLRPRFLQLPLDEFPGDRACDLAWRLQLALDAVAGAPSRYRVSVGEEEATLTVDFPVPLRERRALLHLGGRRDAENAAFRFFLPIDSVDAAEAILCSSYFASARNLE